MKKIFILFLLLSIFHSCKKEMPTEKPDDNSNGDSTMTADTIFAGGHFLTAGEQVLNNIGMWDGKKWHPLGTGIRGKNARVECMAFYKGELYVGGFIDSAGNASANHIAKWNGNEWSAVGNGIDGRVTSLIVYQDELYAGGWFFSAEGMDAGNIAKWNGTSWSQVGEGLSDEVYTLTIYKGLLYAGGWFTKNYQGYFNANRIARWDGSKWDTVSSGITQGSWISNLTVFQNELYAVGYFQRCDDISVSNIAKWNDTVWSAVGGGIKSDLSYTAAEFGNELIIGGEIDSVDNRYMPFSAVWDGTKWKYGKFVLDAEPFCLYTFKNNLYIGGLFKTADNILVNGIFKWDGKIIHPFDSGIQGSIVSIRGK